MKCSINCIRHLHHRNFVSRFFQPKNVIPVGTDKNDKRTCKSQTLMLDNGIIAHSSNGTFHLLPFGMRSMEKLTKIIDEEMARIGAQKMDMPILLSAALWKKSGRWDTASSELFKLLDRHDKEYCLGPTHEEIISSLLATSHTLSYKQLPLRLYQIAKKFRDEKRAHFGFLRAREFYMKDLYTFDINEEQALDTYEKVCESYNIIFDRLGLKVIKAQGSTGMIGGSHSHEFHVADNIGEDDVLQCHKCKYYINVELLKAQFPVKDNTSTFNCPTCNSELELIHAIEVGHTFLLGTKYSQVFDASYLDNNGKPKLFEMGCYGLGVTRILAAALEAFSTNEQIRWPSSIAPFQLCILTPKRGSKEDMATPMTLNIYDSLSELPHLTNEIVIDDRDSMTIGRRMHDAKKLGYPYIIVAGRRAVDPVPLFEFHMVSGGKALCTHATLHDFFCHISDKGAGKISSINL